MPMASSGAFVRITSKPFVAEEKLLRKSSAKRAPFSPAPLCAAGFAMTSVFPRGEWGMIKPFSGIGRFLAMGILRVRLAQRPILAYSKPSVPGRGAVW